MMQGATEFEKLGSGPKRQNLMMRGWVAFSPIRSF
jgi:hypothetical protein